jgi:hypothetical protein
MSAIEYCKTAYQIGQKLNDLRLQLSVLKNFADACYKSKKFERSLQYYESAKKIAVKLQAIKELDLLNEKLDLFKARTDI